MLKNEKYLIGFDRFIDLDWLNQAYYLSKNGGGYTDQVDQIKTFLQHHISGKDSIRKTANLLSRIWSKDYSELTKFKKDAVAFDYLEKDELIVLHFGMCISIFPFFKEVISQIGKLLFIQGFFQTDDIESRMMDKYSNISSVPRAAQRIVQSINAWGLVDKDNGRKYLPGKEITIKNKDMISWLLKAVLFSSESGRIAFSEIKSLPFLFPFKFELNNREIYLNSEMAIERDGMNNDFLILR